MTKKSRYLLLLAGFAVFLIAAPLLVLYVQGISFDFDSKTFVRTGILIVKSDPNNAELFLNGQPISQGSGTIRFLKPLEYEVEVKKPGYITWNKRLKIQSSEVIYANPPFNSIYLFFENPQATTVQTAVLDFYQNDERLAFLTKDNFSLASLSGGNIRSTDSFTLPQPVNKILGANEEQNIFLLAETLAASGPTNFLIFDSEEKEFYPIKLLASQAQPQLGPDGKLYALENNQLKAIDFRSNSSKLVFDSTKAFYILGSDLYYIKETLDGLSLWVSPFSFTESQLISKDLPQFGQGRLMITFEKQIFLLADNDLYSLEATPRKISQNIDELNFDFRHSTLTLSSSGEFQYLSGLGKNPNFVTRSSEPLTNLSVSHYTYHGFYLKAGQISAIELDTRDKQNTYRLFSGFDVKKFSVDEAAETVWILDGGELKSLRIR